MIMTAVGTVVVRMFMLMTVLMGVCVGMLVGMRGAVGMAMFVCMLMGVFIPAVILFTPGMKSSIKMINLAAALHVVGVLCERYIIVIPGQTHPAEILPNMHVESAGLFAEKVGYSISFLEMIQALGIAAIVALAFILGLKFFAMLPTKALMDDVTGSEDATSTG